MPKATPLTAALPPGLNVRSHVLLASLWSNYGHIYRLTLAASPRDTLILKLIQAPPASASSSSSHLRKLVSYRVERYFYAHLSTRLPALLAPVARSYPVAPLSRHSALLLQDLTPTFPASSGNPHAVLRWLANFHATFWGTQDTTPLLTTADAGDDDAAGVWAQGGYWHLDTRRDEFADTTGYASVCAFAEDVAARLKRRDVPGVTLLHGDCKSANIVFEPAGERCALYDFQYVGVGFGVQDVVYFVATSVRGGRLAEEGEEEALLRLYYAEVVAALERRGVVDVAYTWEVVVEQWECALVDWMRFMAGWGCWGNAAWVERRVRGICRRWEEEGRGGGGGSL
ncbi:hypothetical protein Q9L58_007134 [Maublancomyces gigas]|uniref:Aminoglycoside phosphotransferase domain-containing protein n=1 Tax=Discina gigas TaxID=1032678 RepID=A0ABR3GD95_9PEZI